MSDSKMRVCPNCHAPNPPRLAVCFSCGYVLDSVAQAPHETFGENGIIASVSAIRPFAAFAPPGWRVEPQTDGSVQLRRTGWRRFFDKATLPAVFLFFSIVLMEPGGTQGSHAMNPSSLLLWHCFGVLVLLLGVGAAIWQFGAKEVICAGPGFLERTLALGPINRRWRFEHSADIRIETRQGSDRNGSYTRRRLFIENLGQRMTLEQHFRRDSLLGFGMHLPVVADDVSALGHYLSDLTGWSLIDPELSRY